MSPSAHQPKKPSVLIAGGAGFIGAHLAKALLDKNWKVTAIDNLEGGKKPYFEDLFNSSKFSFIQTDLNKEVPPEIQSPTHIIQLAALETRLYQPEKTDIQSLLTNAVATRNLLELAKNTKARFILASSIEVYRGVLSSQNLENYFGSSTKEAIRFSYAEAKRFAEALTWEYYHKYNLNVVICRLGEVYGPRMNLYSSGSLGKFIADVAAGGDITVYGEGTEKEYYTYIDDTVDGFLKVISDPKTNGKIYPFCPLKGTPIIEIAYLVKSQLSPKPEIFFKPKDVASPLAEIKVIDGQIQGDLGWKIKTSLKEGIKVTLESFLAKKEKSVPKKQEAESKPLKSKKAKIKFFKKRLTKLLSFLKLQKNTKLKIATALVSLVAVWLWFLGPSSLLLWHINQGSKDLNSAGEELKILELEKAKTESAKAKDHFEKAQKNLTQLSKITNPLGIEEKSHLWKQGLTSASYLSDAILNTSNALIPITQTFSSLTNSSVSPSFQNQESLNNLQEAQRNLLLAEAAQASISQNIFRSRIFNILWQNTEIIPQLKGDLELLKSAVQHLPTLLGQEAPQNYLILIKDSHELSPQGGKTVSFVEFTVEKGKIKNLTVNDAEANEEAENSELSLAKTRQNYIRYYEKKGKTIHVFATADLFLIKELLELTGPVFISASNETIDNDTIIERSLMEHPSKMSQKTFLCNLSRELLEKITTIDRSKGVQLAAIIKEGLEERHFAVKFGAEHLDQLFNERGWGGEFLDTNQDFILVTDTNIGASKANFYVKRTLNYEVNLVQKEASLKVNYIHTGKSNAWPGGPYDNFFQVVVPSNITLLSTQMSKDDLETKGEEVKEEISQGLIAGKTVLSANFTLKAQKSLSLEFKYRLPEKVIKDGIYQLAVQKQPGTEKDSLTVSMVLPTKPKTTQPSQNLKAIGNNLTWTWDLEKDRIFEVGY